MNSTWMSLLALLLACSAFSQDTYTTRTNVMIPMRDGTRLAAHIHLPKQEGRYPVLLMRSPYGKPGPGGEAKLYTDHGYVFVAQDCRGRGNSEGTWDPFLHDGEDGFDTQEWVGAQPWCNGKIGTLGGSYVGWTQWSAAPHASKFLKAMVPIVPFGDVYQDIAYPGGAFQLSLLFGWGAGVGNMGLPPAKFMDALKDLPLKDWDNAHGNNVFFIDDWVAHPRLDDYWRKRSIKGREDKITVPILNVGGWYDIFSKTTFDLINEVKKKSSDRLARRNQFLVMGPWGHGVGGQKLGELDFGETAKLDLGQLQAEWFAYWLKNEETGVQNWPAFRIFVMGENKWRDEHEWPLARTRWTKVFLHSKGQANSRGGDGLLDIEAPGDQPEDTFVYDPANPVPTLGGNNLVGPPTGPFDQSKTEDRQDVLVYTSKELPTDIEVTGPVTMVLYASSTATDTDFTAKLVDVYPDGKAYLLCDGIVRARYRDSRENSEFLKPGEVTKFEIDLWVTSNLFKTGHKIRVEVASSNFPRFDRNPNTGADFGSNPELAKATQKIFHSPAYPSHLLLPVIPR